MTLNQTHQAREQHYSRIYQDYWHSLRLLLLALHEVLGEAAPGADALYRVHVVALRGHPPGRAPNRLSVIVVEARRLKISLEGCSGLCCMIARYGREEMVAHVRRSDVVVHPIEDTVGPDVEGAVDCAQGPTHPGPLLIAKVRDVLVCVLHPSVSHKPCV